MVFRVAFGWMTVFAVLVVAAFVLIAGGFVHSYTQTAEFCGNTCHVMKAAFESWKTSEHKDVKCIECHSTTPGGARPTLAFAGLQQAFSYVMRGEGDHPRVRSVVDDLSCAASGCHSGKEFVRKESEFTQKPGIRFIHLTHKVKDFDKIVGTGDGAPAKETTTAKPVPGHELHCDTCHVYRSVAKHFEVPKEVCFVCHFRNQEFDRGRGKCTLCHALPTASLQAQKTATGDDDAKVITHQSLEEAGVPCRSCHKQVIAGDGGIRPENCHRCHFDPETLAKTGRDNMRRLHEAHVAAQQATCFDCHEPIAHKERGDFLDLVRFDCQQCHPDHHRFQKALLTGPAEDGIPATPNPMFRVKTNCLGCHVKKDVHRGQPFLIGSEKACIDCHSKSEGALLLKWKAQIADEVDFAKGLEAEAVKAIFAAEKNTDAEKIAEARAMLEDGRRKLHVVEFGNGVHNKKYALMLLDAAMTRFEDLVDVLNE